MDDEELQKRLEQLHRNGQFRDRSRRLQVHMSGEAAVRGSECQVLD